MLINIRYYSNQTCRTDLHSHKSRKSSFIQMELGDLSDWVTQIRHELYNNPESKTKQNYVHIFVNIHCIGCELVQMISSME